MCRVITLMSTGEKVIQHFLDNVQFDSKTVKPHITKTCFLSGICWKCIVFFVSTIYFLGPSLLNTDKKKDNT